TQKRNRSRFALETPAELFGTDLDRHFAAQPRVHCLEYSSHPSGGEQSLDSIGPKQGSRAGLGLSRVVQQVRRKIAGRLFQKSTGMRIGREHRLHLLLEIVVPGAE